ncbi:DUF3306 domain-containing protein [Tropicibacter oceani]|uniref:DUF3306 domain-containing protein n=1 Tax=Tropicibacter oceani TaxID=3058420 RepID=A0ABY8QNF0_9RHOB|nr:DUF3306 domain-containing protein [Tropicibacter oceani]WGW05551.1 DUF3306 domain-containing protein [Tropicibacter oceani]
MTSFWDRRKAAVEAEQKAERDAEADRARQAQEAALAERPDEDILAELDLPLPETVTDPDQIKKYLNAALPQRLKARALRRLWTLNPVLANLDGLVDYGQDYSDAATVVENMKTSYQVGKGMLAHILDLEEKARQADEAKGEDPGLPEADPEPQDETDTVHDQPVVVAQPAKAEAHPQDEDPVDAPSTARRMRFRFDDTATS